MDFQRNNLDKESSPYLLQHKNNPVWWQAWNEEVLNFAMENDIPILISIGYAACHWCHVMEHESFEDTNIANIMNNNFVCIKIDREERPDIDNIYMNAVQLLNGNGGWPLNVITLPNQKPFFGGTYFPKEKWMHILNIIAKKYKTEKNQLIDYADSLYNGLLYSEIISTKNEEIFSGLKLKEIVKDYKHTFDKNWGGNGQAPKFPTPCLWGFLLRYGVQNKDIEVLEQVKLTLNRMSWGGIFDVVGGGFSRYSVDPYWKVPHFEKMLYDNAQLLSLYGNAYKVFKNDDYKKVFIKIFQWLKEDMISPEGLFYSSIDADTEGQEGKYYVWETDELKSILNDNYPIFKEYFNIDGFGKWENSNILIQLEDKKSLAIKLNISENELDKIISDCLIKLKNARNKKIKPAFDNKCITSWNAMTISGLLTLVNENDLKEDILKISKTALDFLIINQYKNSIVYRNYINNKSEIKGLLEDYAFLLKALIDYYQASFDKKYIFIAKELLENIKFNFYNKKTKLFQFNSMSNDTLIIDTYPIYDSAEPSANSIMAENLFRVGKIFSENLYIDFAKEMLTSLRSKIEKYPFGFANWLYVVMNFENSFYEIVIMGKECFEKNNQINFYHPNAVIVGSNSDEYLPLMENRLNPKDTFIYVCRDRSCQLPQKDISQIVI